MPETQGTQDLITRRFDQLNARNLIIAAVALVLTLFAVAATGWFGDHRSCQRSAELRTYIRAQIPIDEDAAAYWGRRGNMDVADLIEKRLVNERKVRQLQCGGLLPGV
jgi:hypothetical protein